MIDDLLNSQGEDRILLLSGGPKSHLAQRSMFAKGMKKRLVITQPSMESQVNHSPLNGETILQFSKKPMEGSLQIWSDNGWKVTNILNAKNLEGMFRSLISHTPKDSLWAGALS